MTADELELLSADEADVLLAERYTRLTAAGYPPTSALVVATRIDLDLELAAQLVAEAPCSLSLRATF